MAPTYATADASTYCGHPSHDGPPWPIYSEFWDADICGNCGIPIDRHGDECGEWTEPGTSSLGGIRRSGTPPDQHSHDDEDGEKDGRDQDAGEHGGA